MNTLSNNSLPNFNLFTTDYFNLTLTEQLKTAYKTQYQIAHTGETPTWNNTVIALEAATEPLSQTWGMANHLQSVLDTPELRECVNNWLPKISDFFTQLGQDLKLMMRYESLQQQAHTLHLTADQTKVLDNALRDFVLSGAKLPETQREHFANNEAAIAQLQQKFSEHVLDATKAFEYLVINADELDGLPTEELSARAAAAQAKQQSGYLLTLQMPSYLPVMQYAKNRELREKLYRAYVTRASELGDAQYDNTPLMYELIRLRHEQAQLLGYNTYADLSLATKMAESPEQVNDFLIDLANKAKPGALLDWTELKAYAAEHLNLSDLQAWDIAYASEHLRQAKYAYSDHEVKQYFQEPNVFKGLFNLIETLFKVRFLSHTASVWHDSVQVFSVNIQDKTIGYLYVDAYAREGKQGGAWMNSLISRTVSESGDVQLPVALVVCNTAQPINNKPALLSHDEVITLFHEFGHALHHLLTQAKHLPISGISGVEWDAVELPSQFMENYCWEWSVLQHLTAHSDTQEKMPLELFNKLLAAKNFQAGLGLLRQIEFSVFDMRLHQNTHHDIHQLLTEVRQHVSINPPPAFNRFAHSFGHIFSGGYAAGYYSYKWAEVLSADAFAAFEETGNPLDGMTGIKFRDCILATGGSRSMLDNFIEFRGREPSAQALLRHTGLTV
jgi:oligopeptidase A